MVCVLMHLLPSLVFRVINTVNGRSRRHECLRQFHRTIKDYNSDSLGSRFVVGAFSRQSKWKGLSIISLTLSSANIMLWLGRWNLVFDYAGPRK